MSTWGDFSQGMEDFRTPLREDHFSWDAPIVNKAGCAYGQKDEFYMEVVSNSVDRGLRPDALYFDHEFADRWENRALPTALPLSFEIVGHVVFVRNPAAFFKELAAKQKVYRRHLSVIRKMRESPKGHARERCGR
jgi:tRNA G37 N-methylase Trm5